MAISADMNQLGASRKSGGFNPLAPTWLVPWSPTNDRRASRIGLFCQCEQCLYWQIYAAFRTGFDVDTNVQPESSDLVTVVLEYKRAASF